MTTYTKLDPEFKEQWLLALRSGEYKQARNKLRGPHRTFCCLGVGCDVIGPKDWRYDRKVGWIWANQFLPNDLSLPWIDEHAARELSLMNDRIIINPPSDNPFDEIADWIEENL